MVRLVGAEAGASGNDGPTRGTRPSLSIGYDCIIDGRLISWCGWHLKLGTYRALPHGTRRSQDEQSGYRKMSSCVEV